MSWSHNPDQNHRGLTLAPCRAGGVTWSGLEGPLRRGPLTLTGVAGWCPLLMGSWMGVARWRSQLPVCGSSGLPRGVATSRQMDPVHGLSTWPLAAFRVRVPRSRGETCKSITSSQKPLSREPASVQASGGKGAGSWLSGDFTAVSYRPSRAWSE